MKLQDDQWDLEHLRTHLQAAAELEAWTIPYYMAAMFSIVDRSTEAYQLIQSVVNQEMLHLQLVGNIANSYGYSPVLGPGAFQYEGTIPHLDFSLDPDNPTDEFFGNTLLLHGRTYSPPYVMAAVGNPDTMIAALEAEPGVRTFRQYAARFGLGFAVEVDEAITVPGYDGAVTTRYAQPAS